MSSKLSFCYEIEGTIIFNPEYCALTNQLDMKSIQLKQTASLCLLLLLKNHNKVITQNEILEFAWGERHREVTFNAYYQIILSLRKALSDIGLEKQIITTIIRKGLIIRGDICVEQIAVPEEIFLTEKKQHSDFKQNMENNEHVVRSRLPLLLSEKIILIMTIAVCIFLVIMYMSNKNNNFFSGYIPSPPYTQNCQYFINGDAINPSHHENIIKTYSEICKDGQNIYITAYPETVSSSVLMCKKPVTDNVKNSCSSIFFPRKEKK
ncbi:transcriptional regulator [Salmonella enterica subsp. enterica]|nr:transcriptional regulator [Salmonella enterica subsp. enterica serovar Braenderup]